MIFEIILKRYKSHSQAQRPMLPQKFAEMFHLLMALFDNDVRLLIKWPLISHHSTPTFVKFSAGDVRHRAGENTPLLCPLIPVR